jgi:hypothetical protein
MNDNKKIAKVVLEIEWTSTDEIIDNPATWDWKRIKGPMSIDKVKYIGPYPHLNPESVINWMGN